MRFATADVATLACPICRGSLLLQASRGSPHDGGRRSPDAAALHESPGAAEVRDGIFTCSRCYHEWPLRDGVPQLCDEDRVSGIDRALRPIYDFIAPYHDLGADVVLPLLQFPDFGASRDRYVRELRLGELRPHADGSPVRILEVGIGSGANVPLVHAALLADATFDRVFHVGGINGYRDVRKALAEMARVARAGTPIVVVDEELDPDRS